MVLLFFQSTYSNNDLFFEPQKRDFIQFNFKDQEEATQFRNKIILNKKDRVEIVHFIGGG